MHANPPTDSPQGPLAVRTTGLIKRYKSQRALDGVDLKVPEGSVYVLVGPNGAGKTTLLKVLLDLVRPQEGSASVFGMDVVRHGAHVRVCIGFVPETNEWGYGWMKVERMLKHHSVYYPEWDWDYANALCRTFQVKLDQRYDKLSKGQARRVQLVMALAHRPPLLLLDEPTDGLDPVMQDETLALLVDHMAASPTTLLISTHRVHEVERIADHLGVLRDGKLQTQMPVEQLRRTLRRYRADVPDGWGGVQGLNGAVVRRGGSGREAEWTVWGEESEIIGRFTASGATVRDASVLTLEEATLALLGGRV